MYTIFRKTAWAAGIVLLTISACKRDHDAEMTPPKAPTPSAPHSDTTSSTTFSSRDSMYFLFKDEYLWNDVIPDSSTFKPNSFSNLEDMFTALISYKKNTAGKNMDNYSFLDKGATASEIGEGQASDFGIGVKFNNAVNDLRVAYVYEGASAYQQGIRRGWRITAINGNSQLTFDGQNGPTSTRIKNAIYHSQSIQLKLRKPDGSTVDISLNAANYTINPVLYSSILNVGDRKVGYLVFNQFVAPNIARPKVDPVFTNFINNGITDLIVDLRYNGGGDVQTAEYLANLIAPNSVGSNVMYKEFFNTNLTAHQYSQFLDKTLVPGRTFSWGFLFDQVVNSPTFSFNKAQSLNLNDVVFIGTDGTASASELVINVLKPYMNVKLVGDTTYGKPVAFFDISVGGYDMYAPSVWLKNAQGQGDYFDGFIPDDNAQAIANNTNFEDYNIELGNTSEVYLRRALIMSGIPESTLGRLSPVSENLRRRVRVKIPLDDSHFKGMIETRFKFR
jgi:C-terminal processing protease CtpA/Prc